MIKIELRIKLDQNGLIKVTSAEYCEKYEKQIEEKKENEKKIKKKKK